jgi:hypothetical protein
VLRHIFGVLDLRQPQMLGVGDADSSTGSGDGGSDGISAMKIPPEQMPTLTRQGSDDGRGGGALDRVAASAGGGSNSPAKFRGKRARVRERKSGSARKRL